ncbi:hypothetical protein KEM52_000682, partial [Ascosphaera acerosa]
GYFDLDGVVSVVDVENWGGYEDTSYTARMQARCTDLIILNKWEYVTPERLQLCIARMHELEVPTALVKSNRGWVDKDVLLGLDSRLLAAGFEQQLHHHHHHEHNQPHHHDHQSEIDVLSVTLTHPSPSATVNAESLVESFLDQAPKDEVYRVKGILRFSDDHLPEDNSGLPVAEPFADAPVLPLDQSTYQYHPGCSAVRVQNYILNWAFSRYTFTPASVHLLPPTELGEPVVARLTVMLARGTADAWMRRLLAYDWVSVGGQPLQSRQLAVVKVA